jgi:hypothetical protein
MVDAAANAALAVDRDPAIARAGELNAMSTVRRARTSWSAAVLIAVMSLGLMASAALDRSVAASSPAPELTVHARYVPADHNIAFSGIALAKGGRMLAYLQFRLEQETGGRWQPISVWMALITGVGARWQPDGRYRSQLMAMQEPVPAGRLRVEMRVADSGGLVSVANSNPVTVP